MAVNGHGVPAERTEELLRVLALSELRHRVKRHVIGVVNENEVVQSVVPRESGRLARDAFLKATVTGEHDDVVVDNPVLGGIVFGGRHFAAEGEADSVRHTLAERAGGAFDADGLKGLRMTRSLAAQRAEVRDLLHWQIIAREMQPSVEEHGAMACREHKAVTVQPLRVGWIALQKMAEECRAHLRRAEWQAEVAGRAFVDRVHGKTTGFVGGFEENVFVENGHGGRIGSSRKSEQGWSGPEKEGRIIGGWVE